MAIDPSIVLGIKPVQVASPIDLFTKQAALRNMISETSYRDQEAQTNQLKAAHEQQQNDEADRDLAAQKAEGELMAQNSTAAPDGTITVNHAAVTQGLAQAGFGKQASTYLTRVQLPDQKNQIEVQKGKIANAKEQLDTTGQVLQSLQAVPDEDLPAAYDQNVADLQKKGLLQPGTVPPAATIVQQGGVGALRQFVNQHAAAAMTADQQVQAHQKDLDYALNLNKFQQDTAQKAPETRQKWAESLGGLLAKAPSQDAWSATLKAAVQQGAPLDIVNQFGAQFSPEAQQNAAQLGMTVDQQEASADKAAQRDQAAANAVETNRHNVAVEATDKAKTGIEASKNARDQQIYEQTYGSGANQAIVGVDPKLRVQAVKEAQKAADDFQTAQKAADTMQSMIDASRGGNKAAGSNLPLVGVETLNALNGIKRINRTEVDQYQGAGDLLDRIQGKIGKLVTGQPIPSDVLDDVEKLNTILRGNSAKTYRDRLSGINQNYKANFQPVKGAEAGSGGVARPQTQQDFDALPKGAHFIGKDGKTYVKN